MGRKEKLLKKASTSPKNLKFDEICKLAEFAGYEFRNQTGSHRIYKHAATRKLMNFQPCQNGKAKPKQVRELLNEIDRFNLIGGKNE